MGNVQKVPLTWAFVCSLCRAVWHCFSVADGQETDKAPF